MKKKINLSFGVICYIVSFFLIIYYLILEFSILDVTSPIDRLKIIFLIIILMYIGNFLLKQINFENYYKLSKINMWIWFTLYIIMLLNLTLFDKYFGRGITLNVMDPRLLKNYLEYNFNIIPFATINNYFLAFKNNNLTNMNFIYNIFGNILAFAPLGLFLPRQFPKINKWYKFFIITSITILLIESLQMITMSGSFDIDDYILNSIGAMVMYFILNNKWISPKINKFLYFKSK